MLQRPVYQYLPVLLHFHARTMHACMCYIHCTNRHTCTCTSSLPKAICPSPHSRHTCTSAVIDHCARLRVSPCYIGPSWVRLTGFPFPPFPVLLTHASMCMPPEMCHTRSTGMTHFWRSGGRALEAGARHQMGEQIFLFPSYSLIHCLS